MRFPSTMSAAALAGCGSRPTKRAGAGLRGARRFVVWFTPKGGGGRSAKIEVFAENKAKALTETMKRLKGRFSKILKVT